MREGKIERAMNIVRETTSQTVKREGRALQISPAFVLSYFAESLCISDTANNFADYAMNMVEQDIVLRINELHDLGSVWKAIKREYAISDVDTEAQSLFGSYVTNLLEKGILMSGRQPVPIIGTRGACYPIRTTIELTNKCNFECTHCYKEAGKQCDRFIDTELALRVLDELKENTWLVEFTGGEALLHPDFEKIVTYADFPSTALFTNGSLLDRVSVNILRKFDSIQVTLYGDTDQEYRKYARSSSFEKVCQNIREAVDSGANVVVAIILRKSNYQIIEQYIRLIYSLGVRSVRFGLTSKVGRNSAAMSEWDLSPDECCLVDEQLLHLKQKYVDMKFEDFDWRNDFVFPNEKSEPHTIKCGAGKKSIVISESGIVRPCVVLPAEYFNKLPWDDYLSTIKSEETVCYDDCVQRCLCACKQEGRSIDSICNYAFG